MKKIIAMVIVVITMLVITTGCMGNNSVDEEIVRQYCESEGKTLVHYDGMEYDSIMEDDVYRYVAIDNETSHKLICTSNAEWVRSIVD